MDPDISLEKAFVTFIIPSIGRPTLSKTLESLINQTNPNWKAIVIFDGISPTIESLDSRIRFIESEKLGQGFNSAGLVRNYGMQFVDTDWIAFVDDDDSVSNDYVAILKKEILEYNAVDLIIFRMEYDGTFYPKLESESFHSGDVGISFACKTEIVKKGHLFEPSGVEDFNFLDGARNKNYKIMVSPYIKYFVKTYKNNINYHLGTRSFINFEKNKKVLW